MVVFEDITLNVHNVGMVPSFKETPVLELSTVNDSPQFAHSVFRGIKHKEQNVLMYQKGVVKSNLSLAYVWNAKKGISCLDLNVTRKDLITHPVISLRTRTIVHIVKKGTIYMRVNAFSQNNYNKLEQGQQPLINLDLSLPKVMVVLLQTVYQQLKIAK